MGERCPACYPALVSGMRCGRHSNQTVRRLIGWRVRWEWFAPGSRWEPKCGRLVTLPEARRHVQLFRGHTIYRNVRVMRVYRRRTK